MNPGEEGRLALYAVGNVLHRDDGVGSFALDFITAHWHIPQSVTVGDLGTPGASLVEHLLGFERVVILDAFRGSPAGALARWERDAPRRRTSHGLRHCHDACLADTLTAAVLFGSAAQVVVLGVRAADTAPGIGLSRVVRLAVPALAEQAVEELAAAGAEMVRRTEPLPLGMWWEAAARPGFRPTPAGPPSAAPGRFVPTVP